MGMLIDEMGYTGPVSIQTLSFKRKLSLLMSNEIRLFDYRKKNKILMLRMKGMT
jgi:hypothetical protein